METEDYHSDGLLELFEDDDLYKGTLKLFDILGDVTRFKIIYALNKNGSLDMDQICEKVQTDKSIVSSGLASLYVARMIKREQVGKNGVYSLNRENAILQGALKSAVSIASWNVPQ